MPVTNSFLPSSQENMTKICIFLSDHEILNLSTFGNEIIGNTIIEFPNGKSCLASDKTAIARNVMMMVIIGHDVA